MKVGILTQHFLLNYGGIIQNYALQQVLIKLGHEPLTFEHDTCYSRTWWLLRTVKQVIKRRSFKTLPTYPTYRGRVGQKNFIKFVLKNIKSVPVRDFTTSLTSKYGIDAYVVGSDQVWRPAFNLGPRLGQMFLDFADDNVKKIAYAASFGTSEWEYDGKQEERCKALAKRFDAISVREDSGVKLCKDHLDVDAVQVLDPTLLLEKDDYLNVCSDVPVSKPHIFVYSLVVSDKVMTVANDIANKTGLSIEVMEAGSKVKPEDSIEKWFAHFRDADYIVTDSFHGMVFSIIFNKPFYIVMNASGGNSRYTSLLSMLGLIDRIITDDAARPSNIDWNSVNEKRKTMCIESLNFLKENLR